MQIKLLLNHFGGSLKKIKKKNHKNIIYSTRKYHFSKLLFLKKIFLIIYIHTYIYKIFSYFKHENILILRNILGYKII